MKLIIAEKSIAGQRIASILAGKNVSASIESSAQLFEFSKNKEKFALIPLKGHIVDVDFPKQYSYWLGTDIRKLADVEVEYVGQEKFIISLIQKKSKEFDEVIIATDSDREGESIGLEALNFVKEKNPKIKIKRASFSAITPSDINEAFSSLGEVNYDFAESANARREVDLIWGACLTRFVSIVSGRLGNEFLSVGRVQSPVLALIVDREKERLKFKPEKYWEIVALFEKDKKQFEAMHKKGRIDKEEEAKRVGELKEKKGIVAGVEKKKRILKKPSPFNTTEFLRAASAIGVSAGEAMNIAESLYMNGFISYPRTDNTVYPPSLNLKNTLNELLKVPEFVGNIQKIFSQKQIVASKGEKETKDHPPIHPVSAAQKLQLNERQWKVYELVVRRFLATLGEDAETENLSVEILLGKEPFIARGQVILKKGWKEFYPYSLLKEIILPSLSKGEEVDLKNLSVLGKETLPPPRYSQGALIKLMEDLGLGTKSTRHEIIKKLYSRKYVSGIKAIEPNNVAFAITDALEKYSPKLVKPQMTSELEKEMDSIAAGKKTKEFVVKESRGILKQILNELVENKNTIGSEIRKALSQDKIMGKCTTCDGSLRMLVSRNNKRFLGCTNYPKCTTTFPLPQKGSISAANKLCNECNMPMIKVIGKRFRFEMCVNPNCKTKDEWKKKMEEKKLSQQGSESLQQAVKEKIHKKTTE